MLFVCTFHSAIFAYILAMLESNLQVHIMYDPIDLVSWPHLARVVEGSVALLNFSHDEVVNH